MASASSPILGHRAQLADLHMVFEYENISHAYLFEGPAHVGKFTIAKEFAEVLLSFHAPAEEEERIRNEVKKLLHPDLLAIDLLWREDILEDLDVIAGSSNISQVHRIKAKAKTDTISIDDVRALQARLYEVPRAQYRCCLIKNVERLQPEAVNSLLKVLEEPPKGLIFLLTTSAPEQVLPTLRSRARRVAFHHLSRAELRPLVAGLDEDEAQFLLHVAQGAPGIIVRMRNDPEKLREERQLSNAARTFWHESSTVTRLQLLTPLHERTEEADRFLLHLSLALRELPQGSMTTSTGHFRRFLRGMDTNVSRPLLCAELAMSTR